MPVTDHFGVVSPAASERDFDNAQVNVDAIGVPITVATLLPFMTVTSTDDAATVVVVPITTTTVVALAYVQYGLITCSQNDPTLGKPVPVAVTVLDL